MATKRRTEKFYPFRADEKPESYWVTKRLDGKMLIHLPDRKLHLLDMEVLGRAQLNADLCDDLKAALVDAVLYIEDHARKLARHDDVLHAYAHAKKGRAALAKAEAC